MRTDNVLTLAYMEKHPENAARVLENFPYPMSAQTLGQLAPDQYLATFQMLIPSYAASLLDTLEEENKGRLVNALSGDMLSRLLKFYDEDKRKTILNHLSSDKRSAVIRHMQYPMGTVGTIMGPPTFSLPDEITTAEALKRIKNSKKKYPPEIFIVNRSLHYIGVVTLDKLIKTPPDTKLGIVTDLSARALSTRRSLRNLTNDPAWETTRRLPVTDSQGVFAGILDYRALQHYKKTEKTESKPQATTNFSILDLVFQALAILLERLVMKMFPEAQPTQSRGKRHDNVT